MCVLLKKMRHWRGFQEKMYMVRHYLYGLESPAVLGSCMVFASTSTAPVSMGCLYLVHQIMWYCREETELLLLLMLSPIIKHAMFHI